MKENTDISKNDNSYASHIEDPFAGEECSEETACAMLASVSPQITLEKAKKIVARMDYSTVKAVLRSHKIELWLDQENIVRLLLAEKIESGAIADPTNDTDTVMHR